MNFLISLRFNYFTISIFVFFFVDVGIVVIRCFCCCCVPSCASVTVRWTILGIKESLADSFCFPFNFLYFTCIKCIRNAFSSDILSYLTFNYHCYYFTKQSLSVLLLHFKYKIGFIVPHCGNDKIVFIALLSFPFLSRSLQLKH